MNYILSTVLPLTLSLYCKTGKIRRFFAYESLCLHFSVSCMFLTQPTVGVTVLLGQNTSVPIHTPVVFTHFIDREVAQSMSFNLVTMSSTRDWVVDILIIDVKTGDVRLKDGWETRIRDQGSKSFISRYKGKGSHVIICDL